MTIKDDNSAWLCSKCWQKYIVDIEGKRKCFTNNNTNSPCELCGDEIGTHHLVSLPNDIMRRFIASRRVVRLECSFEWLSNVISGGIYKEFDTKIETDAPQDLEVIGISRTQNWRSAYLYCESEQFEPVVSGEDAPILASFFYALVRRED